MRSLTRREALAILAAIPAAAGSQPELAITIDDAAWRLIPEDRRPAAEAHMLEALGNTQAFLFAAGENVDNEHGAAILERWSAAGHRIGNHTYGHFALFAKTDPGRFEEDILRAEKTLSRYSGFRKWFRFPALKEGHTREVRDRLRAFLAQHGYRNGSVTIDASDWYYSQRLVERLKKDPQFDTSRYRQPYLDHLLNRARYYDQLSRDALGRSVRHTLLVHYNLLNGLFLGDVLAMFRSNGWRVIDAEQAFADPVFTRRPDTVPAGESLIWALAKEAGGFEQRLRYPGEDVEYEKPLMDRLGL